MEWSQAMEDPALKNLPYKIELNRWGKVVLSPASNRHGWIQSELSGFLREHRKDGMVITECSVATSKGVKVADVAWGSGEFFRRNEFETPYQEAPDLCIEIVSPSNVPQEMEEKVELYLAKGAEEVWICEESGRITFHAHRGIEPVSRLFPHAPNRLEI